MGHQKNRIKNKNSGFKQIALAGKRNKEQTIQRLLDAVGEILKEKGHVGLGVNKIAARAGVNKKLIYYYFQSVNNLVKTYIRKKDYWLPLFDSFQWPDSLERERLEQLFIDFLVEQLRFFDKETEMQKLILWQISEANPLMRGISDLREVEGAKFLKLTDPYFKDSDVDFRSICALLVGGIYYIVLHRYHNQSTICGIDISRENDYLQLIISIRQILEWTWKAAAESKNDPTENKSTTNMKYELEELEYRVKSLINGESQTDKELSEWASRIEKLPKTLMENALSLDDSKLPMFVRWHQEGLVELIDLLYRFESPNQKAPEMIAQLENLLRFLQRSFKSETNSDLPITQKLWDTMLEELPVKIERIRTLLNEFKIEASLKEITLIPLTNWLDKRTLDLPSFQQYLYAEMYVIALETWLKLGYKVNHESLLYKFVELNFNHLRSFHYWVKHIEQETKTDGRKKEIILKRLKRNIQHVVVRQQSAYNTHANSLKDQLDRWIDEEISLINDEQLLNGNNAAAVRVKINLPVSAIAYFNKLLYKYRFYDEENQTLIMRHTVDNYSSIDTEEMSFNSYGSKYRMKTPPDAAARALRKILKPIMEEVDNVLN